MFVWFAKANPIIGSVYTIDCPIVKIYDWFGAGNGAAACSVPRERENGCNVVVVVVVAVAADAYKVVAFPVVLEGCAWLVPKSVQRGTRIVPSCTISTNFHATRPTIHTRAESERRDTLARLSIVRACESEGGHK